MVKYIDWLADRMPKKGFALILDVYKSHLNKEFVKEAKKKHVELIYVPACGTGEFQPLDISVFGVFKKKLQKYEKFHEIPDKGTKRFGFFKDMIVKTWAELSERVFEKGWELPLISLSDSEFEYTYEDEDESQASDDKSSIDDPDYIENSNDNDN